MVQVARRLAAFCTLLLFALGIGSTSLVHAYTYVCKRLGVMTNAPTGDSCKVFTPAGTMSQAPDRGKARERELAEAQRRAAEAVRRQVLEEQRRAAEVRRQAAEEAQRPTAEMQRRAAAAAESERREKEFLSPERQLARGREETAQLLARRARQEAEAKEAKSVTILGLIIIGVGALFAVIASLQEPLGLRWWFLMLCAIATFSVGFSYSLGAAAALFGGAIAAMIVGALVRFVVCEMAQSVLETRDEEPEKVISPREKQEREKERDAHALYKAALDGHVEEVRRLLAKGVPVDSTIGDGETPLHGAARGGREAVARLLLAKGASVNAVSAVKVEYDWNESVEYLYGGETPLHMAAGRGHEAVVRLLLDKGAVVDAVDSRNDMPLHQAARGGHLAVVQLLRDKGADRSGQPW